MWPDQPQTQKLLDQIQQGQAEAVERLLDVHREPLRRMINLRLDPALAARVDASDIVQDVLLEAHRRLSDYLRNPIMPFHLWLRHIAKDHVIDAHRRHRQAQRRSLDREQPLVPVALADHSSFELAGQLLDQEPTPASAAIQKELQKRLELAIAGLEEDDRDIVLMRHAEQLTNQEVAAALGLTEAAASMRYLRAVRRLRQPSAAGRKCTMSPGVQASPAGTQARDELLAGLLEQLNREARQGKAPNVDALAEQNPDLAEELRQLWATAQFADCFARSRPPIPPTVDWQPADSDPGRNGADRLPRQFGDFELLAKLGQGGMGVVYKAWQRSLKRTVALKMILRGDRATAADQARFRVEAEAAAHLDHPNIVAVYDAGECEGMPYFSMRHVEGQTLAALLTAGPMRPRDAARLLATISRAVDSAHRKGILHRDLKPSNVLIDRGGVPHVTDFGLAKRVAGSVPVPGDSGLTISGAIVGTPAYMAPEQVSGSRGTPSPASDVYSLGVILYEMVTGRPPFQAPTPVDTLLLVLDQEPVQPRLLNPKVDSDLELICLKCLQKQPDLRYQSAGELAADLEAYLNNEPLSVRSGGLWGLTALLNRMLRETHHAVVLENWGLLWMWHSVTVFGMCVLTNAMLWLKVDNPLWYLLLWGGGLVVWGSIFWRLRKRGGPVLFVERQVAHVWGAAVLATMSVFVVEYLLPPPKQVLMLSPILAVIAGMTFMAKAGMLSGAFYIAAAGLYLTAIPMALYPDYGPLMFGVVSALCFFIPGLKYHRQRLRSLREQAVAQGERE